MAPFHPFNIPDDLIVVRKRDIVANSIAFSLAVNVLGELTGHDSQHWMDELIKQAREHCNNKSREEVEEFINGAQKIADEQCK
jgi:hypothetical protein